MYNISPASQGISSLKAGEKHTSSLLKFSRQVVNESPVPTFILDSDGCLQAWNAACEKIFGIRAADVLGAQSMANVAPAEICESLEDLVFYGGTNGNRRIVSTSLNDNDKGHYSRVHRICLGRGSDERRFLVRTKALRCESGGFCGCIRILEDVTDHVSKSTAVLESPFDQVTGLPGRSLFFDRLSQSLLRSGRNHEFLALFYLHIQPAEGLGDCHDDEIDRFLRMIAERLKFEVRAVDTVAYCGCFEFAVAATNFLHIDFAADLARRLLNAVSLSVEIDGKMLPVSCKLGISVFPDDGTDEQGLFERAVQALQDIKHDPRKSLNFSCPDLNAKYAQLLDLQAQLRSALARNELSLHYQLKASLKSGKITGMEALLRWHNSQFGWVSPGEFIPMAERMGLINDIGKWVFNTACEQFSVWQQAGLSPPPVSINLSTHQFKDPVFIDFILNTLERTGVDPRYLELEITESSVIGDVDAAIAILNELKRIGLTVSLDDFGTGYSSLSHLGQLPVDKVKIDRAFIQDVSSKPSSAEIVKATIAISRVLDLKVVAEGVEKQEQVQFLQRLDCDELQGFYFSRPVAAETLGALLKNPPSMDIEQHDEHDHCVLIVDDDEAIRRCLMRELTLLGYEVETASHAEEGFAALSRRNIPVVIADYHMPGLNGIDFLERVKKIYPATVRIAISGLSSSQTIAENVNRGAIFKYIFKPWDSETLEGVLVESFEKYKKQLSL